VTYAVAGGPGSITYKGFTFSSSTPTEKTFNVEKLGPLKKEVGPEADWGISYEPALGGHEPLGKDAAVRKASDGTRAEHLVGDTGGSTVTDGDAEIRGAGLGILREGDRVRVVATRRRFVQVRVGDHAVRGMGPFDLTLTHDRVTGTVAGAARTLVTSLPKNLRRPMYRLDGRRWMSGFPDEPSAWKAAKKTPFAHAIGVPGGRHEIEVAEWEWPEQAPVPERRRLRP
jgi:hypothetical protein